MSASNTHVHIEIDTDSMMENFDAIMTKLWRPGIPIYRHPNTHPDYDGTYIRHMVDIYDDVSNAYLDTDCEHYSSSSSMFWTFDHINDRDVMWINTRIALPPAAWTWAQPAW